MKIRRHVLALIAASGNQSHTLPSSRKLGEMFGVSHPTALRAIQSLKEDGYIVTHARGGATTCPENANFKDMDVFGLLLEDGKVAFDSYYHVRLHSALGLALTRKNNRYSIQQLYLDHSSEFDNIIDSSHLAGLLLAGVRNPLLLEKARRRHREGLPAAAFLDRVEGISSISFDTGDCCRRALDLLFKEGRRRIVLLAEPRIPEAPRFAAIAADCCRLYELPPENVLLLNGTARENSDRLRELLAFGMRFDAVVGFRRFDEIYQLVGDRLDLREECRMVNLEFVLHEDLGYTGYGIDLDLDAAARKLILHLLAQQAGENPPLLDETIPCHFNLYQGGQPCSPQSN